jgi:hypothetical protein
LQLCKVVASAFSLLEPFSIYAGDADWPSVGVGIAMTISGRLKSASYTATFGNTMQTTRQLDRNNQEPVTSTEESTQNRADSEIEDQ